MVKFETDFDNITKDDVIKALNYIDKNGVPEHNVSVKYFLVTEDGKKYPPQYVFAVAAHFANGIEIYTEFFSHSQARNYLKNLGFKIETKNNNVEELFQNFNGYKNSFSAMLIESKNIIFRGAPGTGKTYLAKKIAADIISNGKCDDYKNLNEEQKKQVEFVQFHPSYDYSDFVEGLRPKKMTTARLVLN